MAISVRSIPGTRRAAAAAVRSGTTRAHLGLVVFLADVLALAVAVNLAGIRGGWTVTYAATVVAVVALRGHYRMGITPAVSRDAGSLLGCLAVPAVALAAVAPDASLPGLVRLAAFSLPLAVAGRAFSYGALRGFRRRGLLIEPTLVVGAGSVGQEVARILQEHPEYGLVPVGFLDTFDDPGLPLPVLGGPRSLDVVLREYEIRRVVIAFGGTREPDMVPIVRACDQASVDIHVLPRFFELGVAPGGTDTDDIWGIPLVRLRRGGVRPGARVVKRAFDVLVGGALLAATAPLLAALAVGVRLSSPGPILFRQRRIGQRGRPVDVLKFRTLLVNDDSDTTWSVRDDDRTTSIGRFLRRTSLDELPQLINVVKGEMSLVGPRPERPFFVERFGVEVARYGDRHRVPAGMTGWAQVHGLRGDTSITERARFDNQYIENWSLWRDIVVLVRTVREMLRSSAG